ncbi:MAG: hypothetical protein JSV80_10380 [Acidobacteriota bacterium]|nr:MAG: hypothetical protein JSV80_10380 [Acidobacteriota bacterium]
MRPDGVQYTKSSWVDEQLVWQGKSRSGQGCEEGCSPGEWPVAQGTLAPSRPGGVHTGGGSADETLIEQLERSLRAAVEPFSTPFGVRWRRAAVSEQITGGGLDRGWRALRHVVTAEALIGFAAQRPRWSRITLLREREAGWPDGFLDAVVRVMISARDDLPECAGQSLPRKTLWLDVFAVADLVRAASRTWLRGAVQLGDRVASPAVEILDPGFFYPAGLDDRDAEGRSVRPLSVISRGRWRERPRSMLDEREGRGCSTGSSVRPSWRQPAEARWRTLVVRAARREDVTPPRDAVVVTRVIVVGGETLGDGFVLERGEPVARWGLSRLPAPDWWLQHIAAFCGPAVPDGNGFPVVAPSALIDAHPRIIQ